MEEYETEYDQEVSEDLDSTEQEDAVTGSEETDQEEAGADPEETEQDGEDPEEDPEEATGEEQPGTEADGTAEDQDEEAGEEPAEGREDETVSGNDIVIKGDVVVFPEGYEPVMSESEGVRADTEAIVQAIEAQNDNMTAGFACTCLMLGVLAGSMIISGFRLRRV